MGGWNPTMTLVTSQHLRFETALGTRRVDIQGKSLQGGWRRGSNAKQIHGINSDGIPHCESA